MNEESRNQIVQNCVALNLPAPHFQQQEEKSIVREILDGVKGMIRYAVKNDVAIEDGQLEPTTPSATEESTNNQSNNQKGFAMNKKFVNLIALLAIASNQVTEEDGSVTLDMDQLEHIENALAEAKKRGQQLKDVEDVLDSVSDNVKIMDGLKNKALALKGLVGQFPIQAPAGNQIPAGASDDKQKKLDETAKDGINQEMRAFYNAKNQETSLFVKKTVESTGPEQAPEDDEFLFTLTLNDAPARDLMYTLFDKDGKFVISKGKAVVYVGGQQPDSRSEKLLGRKVSAIEIELP